ncbi:MAG: VCBS repeat-containing protein [Cyclobacteriaceae bacterium]
MRVYPYFICFLLLSAGCASDQSESEVNSLFTLLSSDKTHVNFRNDLTYDEKFNIYTYRNFYNGGGVALGDVDNDGLLDIYFTGNMQKNRLYRNLGKDGCNAFSFKDITETAGVGGNRAWSTGVSMADVNGDGLLDIYVCNSGDVEGDNKQNELYINNGATPGETVTFTESAEAYGLADRGYSTHAAFFDYDHDGDLDLYLLNNSYQAIGSFNLRKNERPRRDPVGGDKLFRNDDGHFVDVSEAAGIYGSVIGFGLGITVGDVNGDGWQDIFVSNDFFERDYLYINQQNGSFKECLEARMRSISGASMGADMADLNNDGYPEIFVTEMLPEKESRLKTKTTFESWDRYQYNLSNGYYHQFTRNMLHFNNGNDTFSEIGRLTGVHATDWSWGALMTDLDNDGQKDIFVANGIHQDLTDQDYIQFISNEQTVRSIITKDKVDFKKLIDAIPSERIANYMFVNQGDYTFANEAEAWGLAEPSHSNGAAYGDLDNDGDLDLVVNNVNMPPFLYRNETDTLRPDHHYLKISLIGEGKNTFAVGSQIRLYYDGEMLYQEQMPMRGFQSSVDPRPNFGLGTADRVDSLIVRWPDGKITSLANVKADQCLALYQKDATVATHDKFQQAITNPLFQEDTTSATPLFTHRENDFVDFDRDHLLFHMLSTEGPKLAKGDVNGDGLDDFYVGGAKEQAGVLFLQKRNGTFAAVSNSAFEQDKISEDLGSLFFDADGDGDLDLYVSSGGNEFSKNSTALLDRLYINDGKGLFTKSNQILPVASRFESTSCVTAADYDADGDLDLFVGGRLRPFLYGVPVDSYLLENDGKGHFSDVTADKAPSLQKIGMVTDALWQDIDQDGDADLMVVGEWMPISVLINEGGHLVASTDTAGLGHTHGWWNTLEAADLDLDGDIDFVVGNHGLNSRFKASRNRPVRMLVQDFDGNGTAEPIISTYQGDTAYPMVLKHDLVMQLPVLKKKYLKYENYQGETVESIFTSAQRSNALELETYELASSVLINDGQGHFEVQALPQEAQFSPVYGILIRDFDQDGHQDILLGGNLFGAKPEVGRYDASYGLLMKGDGQGNFQPLRAPASGISIEGEVRDIIDLEIQGKPVVLVARNNLPLQFYRLQENYALPLDK